MASSTAKLVQPSILPKCSQVLSVPPASRMLNKGRQPVSATITTSTLLHLPQSAAVSAIQTASPVFLHQLVALPVYRMPVCLALTLANATVDSTTATPLRVLVARPAQVLSSLPSPLPISAKSATQTQRKVDRHAFAGQGTPPQLRLLPLWFAQLQ